MESNGVDFKVRFRALIYNRLYRRIGFALTCFRGEAKDYFIVIYLNNGSYY